MSKVYLVSRRVPEDLPRGIFVIHGEYASRADAQAEVDRREAEHMAGWERHDADQKAAGQDPTPYPDMFPSASSYEFLAEAP